MSYHCEKLLNEERREKKSEIEGLSCLNEYYTSHIKYTRVYDIICGSRGT